MIASMPIGGIAARLSHQALVPTASDDDTQAHSWSRQGWPVPGSAARRARDLVLFVHITSQLDVLRSAANECAQSLRAPPFPCPPHPCCHAMFASKPPSWRHTRALFTRVENVTRGCHGAWGDGSQSLGRARRMDQTRRRAIAHFACFPVSHHGSCLLSVALWRVGWILEGLRMCGVQSVQ